MSSKLSSLGRSVAEQKMADILHLLGHNIESEGLKETPARYVKFLEEYTYPAEFKVTMFKAPSQGMIVQTNIPVTSLCEHHLAPFIGHATVGYIPNDEMVGLSKLSRTVSLFAKRLQTQENMTRQILEFIQEHTNALGIGVIVRAQHTCMCMRGVSVQDVWTTTSELYGRISLDAACRQEFFMHHSYQRSV